MTELTPQEAPNRWTTPCTIEIIRANGANQYRYYGFSDVQLAYLWVEDYVGQHHAENNEPLIWVVRPFETVCSNLDVAYAETGLYASSLVANTSTIQIALYYGQLRI